MSRRRLPPLKSLRAFEAASRHLSFEKAGDELAVTASAVGQQIKSLEAWLGLPLFMRLPSKGVALTRVGERYAASISEALDQLNEATARALRPDASANADGRHLAELRVRLAHSAPRGVSRALPGSRCAGVGRAGPNRLRPGGRGCGHPLRAWRLSGPENRSPDGGDVSLPSAAYPCSTIRCTRCASRATCATTRSCMRSSRRYRTTSPGTNGSRPSASTGIDTSRGPGFPHTYLSLQAAASGQGVALATNVLIGDYLEAGRLARPFPHEVKGAYQYYVVCPEATAERPAIVAFRNWVLDEARAAGQRAGPPQLAHQLRVMRASVPQP